MENQLINNLIEVKEKAIIPEERVDIAFSKIESIISKYNYKKSSLISILLDVQNECNYLPKNALIYVAKRLKVPLIQLYSIATFYKVFSLTPRGKHLVTVCLGTACHVRGSVSVLEEIERKLGIKHGETTKDNEFSLESVNCLGSCALGPVVVVDGEYRGKMTAARVKKLLEGIKK